MRDILLFCEDSFHEKFAGALLNRFAEKSGVGTRCQFRSSRGGLPQLHGELKDFLRDLSKERAPLPDRLLIVVDANCEGYNGRKGLLDEVFQHHPNFQGLASYAIPDPHIERWMLVDPEAFRTVFARG